MIQTLYHAVQMDISGYKTAAGQKTFHYRAVSLWNSLPERLTDLTNLASFKKEIMRHLQRQSLLQIYCKYLGKSCYIHMILIISYFVLVLQILLNVVITLKSQNLERNKVIIIIIVIIIIMAKISQR